MLPVFGKARERARQTTCLSNMKQLSAAVMMYAANWDERMPAADNWSDAILPYVHNEGVFKCPKAPDLKCGYAFNEALSGASTLRISESNWTVLLFESELGWNGSGGVEALPTEPRHAGFDNFAFADGHVMAIRRDSRADM
ncbi:MAG: DUF1559 domain-containing protein, partial [Armatimonadetes bacterium]|nr:DUF1559 domain-containing protein [Armatimonadota bacterium]NIO76827.1 DUF1559 domain-containing protein [Armatimonadota bacterium]NIO99022.1 DUF1559 domain-containing protein [Armatimonadota bacterium]